MMSANLLIRMAIDIINREIKDIIISYDEANKRIAFYDKCSRKQKMTVEIIIFDEYKDVEFYLSQILNPFNLQLEKNYPHLLKYVKVYYIERPYSPFVDISKQVLFRFHPTGIVEYISSITTCNCILRTNIKKVDDTEAYFYVQVAAQRNDIVYKTSKEFHIGIFHNMGSKVIPESKWLQCIETVADFYPNPRNIPFHDMLADQQPIYAGNELWVINDNMMCILVDNSWIPVYPGTTLPQKYQNEYNMFLNISTDTVEDKGGYQDAHVCFDV
jgi:hypothetical protein